MNFYNVQFMTDYFLITTTISANDDEQAERLAEEWLAENGLNVNNFKVLDVTIEKEGEWVEV